MRDIVEELRKLMKDWITGVPYWYTLRDAADEIERLRQKVDELGKEKEELLIKVPRSEL